MTTAYFTIMITLMLIFLYKMFSDKENIGK
jgi:hypothetical protein